MYNSHFYPRVSFLVGEVGSKMIVNFIKEIEVITVSLETQAGIAGNFLWSLSKAEMSKKETFCSFHIL